jgi:hypothetical protein
VTDLFAPGQAHARRDDPETSHEAAAAVTPDLRQLQARVADYARRAGPDGFTDAQMEDDLDDPGSTLRTRRSELTARNIVLDSGRTRRHGDSARQRIIWLHRDFVPGAPPVCEPPAPATPADRAEGKAMSARLGVLAASLRREGRSALADELERAGAIMGKLAG